jgi:hypothetical protein
MTRRPLRLPSFPPQQRQERRRADAAGEAAAPSAVAAHEQDPHAARAPAAVDEPPVAAALADVVRGADGRAEVGAAAPQHVVVAPVRLVFLPAESAETGHARARRARAAVQACTSLKAGPPAQARQQWLETGDTASVTPPPGPLQLPSASRLWGAPGHAPAAPEAPLGPLRPSVANAPAAVQGGGGSAAAAARHALQPGLPLPLRGLGPGGVEAHAGPAAAEHAAAASSHAPAAGAAALHLPPLPPASPRAVANSPRRNAAGGGKHTSADGGAPGQPPAGRVVKAVYTRITLIYTYILTNIYIYL